ncbi:bacillithiol biosynthesis deacetylase BshB1 [Bacillus thermophilus]|uniref:Bacillithiol biosynthesis deacetylase BshB1 n=1 Tax=Siminovitchia thermophila TaxID=1245522 RepID=A0ABS2R2J7_9BACI|nr:bacillithiol biosynthesis deacetylase BshB1 [Siminovitchia thermophila]MBM7713615.1 bacillithiol biosynthesis deacetylase BshB1 [Siminovitchia thermophila]ONK21918.1 bacillithiol biosynthesis deacetylase BshB1 [Bacillus sp. VT-16-64]
MKLEQIDILAFGAHADDVEIGMAGSIYKWASEGKKIVICDLTEAELSSNGTVEKRHAEAKEAAQRLHVHERINLHFPDRGLFMKEEYIKRIAGVIRRYKPIVVFAPFWEDRHPDHGNCAALVKEAFFSAGIQKYEADGQSVHKARQLLYYFINSQPRPDVAVDISLFIEEKLFALRAYESQFMKGPNGVETVLTNGYLERIEARERLYGLETGVAFAEGFKTDRPLLVNNNIFGEGL